MKRWHWLSLVVVMLGGVAVAQYGGSPGGSDNPIFTSNWITGAPGVFPGSGCTTYPGGGRVCGDNKGGVQISTLDGGASGGASFGGPVTAPEFTPGVPLGGFFSGGTIGPPFVCLNPQSDGGCLSYLTAVPSDGGTFAGSAELCSSNGVNPVGCMIVQSTASGANINGNINDYVGNNYCDPSLNTCILPTSTESQLQIGATAPYTFTNTHQYFGTLSGNEIGSALTYGTPPIQNGCEWDFTGSTTANGVANSAAIIRAFNPDAGPACSLVLSSTPSPIVVMSPINMDAGLLVSNGGASVNGQLGATNIDAGLLFANSASLNSASVNFIASVSGLDGGTPPSTPMFCEIGEVTFSTATTVSSLFKHTFTNAPLCVCSLGTETSGTVGPQKCASSTTTFTMTEAASSTGQVNYICCGQ